MAREGAGECHFSGEWPANDTRTVNLNEPKNVGFIFSV
jgi:hypothetical protein